MDMSWLSTAVFGGIVGALVVLWVVVALVRGRRAHPIIDETAFEASAGYTAIDARYPQLMGLTARAGTELKPQGFILLGNERLDAVSRGEFIAKDALVRIVGLDAGFLVVAPAEADAGKQLSA